MRAFAALCCSEVDRVVENKEEGSSAVSCIIDYEGFHSVCLDVWVLQTAYTSTTGSIMVWLKRRLYMSKYTYMYFAKYV